MKTKEITTIRRVLLSFIVLLLLSGITAFPLRTELLFLRQQSFLFPTWINVWIGQVAEAIDDTPELILYGTDWLAFAHIVIALFFVPVYRQPQRYIHNLEMGMLACAGVVPLAFICGPLRGIPFFHQLIDCSFGLFGILPLWFIHRKIKQLNQSTTTQP